MKGRRIILAVLTTLVALATVRADLMPMAPASAPVCRETLSSLTANRSASTERPGETARTEEGRLVLSLSHFSTFLPSYGPGFSAWGRADAQPAGCWPGHGSEGGWLGAEPPVQVLADRQNSLALCLYGLLGFGALRSLSCVRKLSFDSVPHWYHSGAPAQVSYSYAIAPDCLCTAEAYCFVQPASTAEDHIPKYHWRALIAFWWRSQFAPTTLASRAPPRMYSR